MPSFYMNNQELLLTRKETSKTMGLAASQARLLTITARKSDCEYKSMLLSHQKIALSRDMSRLSAEYDDAIAQTKLVYDYYGNSEATPLTYNLMMTPSAMNNYTPLLVTDNGGRVVLDSRLAKAARDAGIPQEGLDGLPSSDLRNAFIDSLYEGTADLANNAVFNDYMDTFDLLMEYNYYKDNPLETVAGGNEDQAQLMALDEVAFWFHGNWATANIRTLDEEGNYGFIPVPVSEDNPNFGKICTLVPGYFCVESSIATEEQQEAAKEFLNWLITSEEGQQYVVNCGNIPAYSNNEAEIGESVSRSAVEYTSSGETFPMYVQYPSDHATNIGASMQQYLAGEIDRTALAQQISDYWTAQN